MKATARHFWVGYVAGMWVMLIVAIIASHIASHL
jgi:hypothetical protein